MKSSWLWCNLWLYRGLWSTDHINFLWSLNSLQVSLSLSNTDFTNYHHLHCFFKDSQILAFYAHYFQGRKVKTGIILTSCLLFNITRLGEKSHNQLTRCCSLISRSNTTNQHSIQFALFLTLFFSFLKPPALSLPSLSIDD